jgi:hypothetical protein
MFQQAASGTEINLVRIRDSTRALGSTMYTLGIHLPGKFHDRCNQQKENGFDVHKKLKLLCYSLPIHALAIILWQEIIFPQSKKNSLHTHLQLQYERFALLEEPAISLSKHPFQLDDETGFSAFPAPNGEWNDNTP